MQPVGYVFLSVCFRSDLGFLNCDGICMCAVHKQFDVLELDSVDVDLQNDEIYLIFYFWVCVLVWYM